LYFFLTPSHITWLQEIKNAIPEKLKSIFEIITIYSLEHSSTIEKSDNVFFTSESELKKFGLEKPHTAIYILRPDTYIGYVSEVLDLENILDYFKLNFSF